MRTMPRPIKTCRLPVLREDDALLVGELLASVWPKPDRGPVDRAEQLKSLGRQYDGPDRTAPVSFLIQDGDAAVAHALTFAREVHTERGPRTVMALAMVASDPAYRGQGLGAAIVGAAFGRIEAGDFNACLFQTSHAVRPFYERLGACVVENPIVNSLSEDDPTANPFWDDVVMRYPLTGDWPTGVIDLQGRGY